MEAHQIVPDILDVAPANVAEVTYAGNLSMQLGNELTPTQVKDAPKQVSWPCSSDELYTVLFTDPDAPSRKNPSFGEVLHWLVINVPYMDLKKGDTIAPYRGSGPPNGTGLHRYVLTIYKQPARFDVDSFRNTYGDLTKRFKFSTRNFVAQHKLGQAVAGNFYQAKYDELVAQRRAEQLDAAFKKEQVVPDVVDTIPSTTVEIEFPSGAFVMMGRELTPTQVKDIPRLVWPTEPNTLYTVVLTDPDAPSRTDPKYREFQHWLVVNVPGNDITKGDTFTEFMGSAPGQGTGLHRYVFLVYKQADKIPPTSTPITTSSNREERRNFSIRKFASQHKLGNPWAGNIYLAKSEN